LFALLFFFFWPLPIGTKLGRDVYWMDSYKVIRFFVDEKYKKETRDPDMSTKVFPYIHRYKLFI
jgi:hypothetical protein